MTSGDVFLLHTLSGASIPGASSAWCVGARVPHDAFFSEGTSVGLPRRALLTNRPLARPRVSKRFLRRSHAFLGYVAFLLRAHLVRTLGLRRLRTWRRLQCDETCRQQRRGSRRGGFQTHHVPLQVSASQDTVVRLKSSFVLTRTARPLRCERSGGDGQGNGCDDSGGKDRSRRGGVLRPGSGRHRGRLPPGPCSIPSQDLDEWWERSR